MYHNVILASSCYSKGWYAKDDNDIEDDDEEDIDCNYNDNVVMRAEYNDESINNDDQYYSIQ